MSTTQTPAGGRVVPGLRHGRQQGTIEQDARRFVAWLAEHDGAVWSASYDAIGVRWPARVFAVAQGWAVRVPAVRRVRSHSRVFVTEAGVAAVDGAR